MNQILNYTDSDFPSLSSRSSCQRKKIPSVKSSISLPLPDPEQNPPDAGSITNIDVNSGKKALKPYKHKEAFRVNIEDAILKVGQVPHKCKSRKVKSFTKNERLGGNPLDADNPVRQKGKIDSRKKSERISKTKKKVFLAREDVKKAKELAQDIIVDKEYVRCKSVIPNEMLWQALYLGKLPEIRKTLSRLDRDKLNDNSESMNLSELNSNPIDEPHVSETDDVGIDIPLRDILRTSSVPSYKLLLHHHNFKRYCDNCITNELNQCSESLISQIVRFQYNKYQRNPIKAVADKRYVLGLKQTKKFTKLHKIKLIVCVPDMEDSMCEFVEELKTLACAYCIPYIFASTRRKLGNLVYKKVGACCFGILDYSGAEEKFNKTMEAAAEAKNMYQRKCDSGIEYCRSHFEEPTVELQMDSKDVPDLERDLVSQFQEKFSISLSTTTSNDTLKTDDV